MHLFVGAEVEGGDRQLHRRDLECLGVAQVERAALELDAAVVPDQQLLDLDVFRQVVFEETADGEEAELARDRGEEAVALPAHRQATDHGLDHVGEANGDAVGLAGGDLEVAVGVEVDVDLDLGRVAGRVLEAGDGEEAADVGLEDGVLLKEDVEGSEADDEATAELEGDLRVGGAGVDGFQADRAGDAAGADDQAAAEDLGGSTALALEPLFRQADGRLLDVGADEVVGAAVGDCLRNVLVPANLNLLHCVLRVSVNNLCNNVNTRAN